MKKLLALALSLMLVLGCAAAMAEEVPELTQLSFDGTGFTIGVPTDWNMMEINETLQSAGVFFYAANADQTRSFLISAVAQTYEDTDALAADLVAQGATEVGIAEINGFTVVTWTLESVDQTGFAILAESGLYNFTFSPASDESYAPIAVAMLQSLQPAAVE